MRRIRILLIVPRYGSVSRGVESFTHELIARLDQKNFDLTVLSGQHSLVASGIHLLKGRLITREKTWWLDRWSLFRRVFARLKLSAADIESLSLMLFSTKILRSRVFDVILPMGGLWTYLFAKLLCPKAKIVGMGHGGVHPSELRFCNQFVALTPYDADNARRINPRVPVVVIPNGVDTVRFRQRYLSEPQYPAQTIMCAAALVNDKNHVALFDAVQLLPKHVQVLCVGDGPYLSRLRRHALYREGRVEFRKADYSEMPDIYRAVHAFSLASLDETFGIVFLEAMSCGLPVVAHHGPKQSFVVGHGGLLCNVRNPAQYAEVLARTLRESFSDRARSQAVKFDWAAVASKYEALFVSLTR